MELWRNFFQSVRFYFKFNEHHRQVDYEFDSSYEKLRTEV